LAEEKCQLPWSGGRIREARDRLSANQQTTSLGVGVYAEPPYCALWRN